MEISVAQIQNFVSQNVLLTWLSVVAVSLVIAALGKVVLSLLTRHLRKLTARTHSRWDDVSLDIVDGLRFWVIAITAFFLLSKSLPRPASVDRILLIVLVIGATYQVGLWGLYLIKNSRDRFLAQRLAKDPSSTAAVGLMFTIVQAVFLAILLLIALDNLGVNVSALVAGLGVGGIAVALAAQNVLGDLLASLSIVLDKPFVIGDFIVAGSEVGTVEHVGVKTTRIKSLSGEQLILSNKDLLESRIRNFKFLAERRVVQSFRVAFSTSSEKLRQIPTWVKEFVEKHEKLRFDRCHFAKVGDWSLDFEFVFYVRDPDYGVFMDLQQKVLLDIFDRFRAEKVDFALPSGSLYVEPLTPAPMAMPAASRHDFERR